MKVKADDDVGFAESSTIPCAERRIDGSAEWVRRRLERE